MKKNKGLFWGLTLFVATMFTACGNVPEPTQEDVIKALEKEGYVTESGVNNNEYSIQMNEVKIDDEQEEATVECVVSYEAETVRICTVYKIKFQIKDDKESWKVKRVSSKERTYELINSISNDDLEKLLLGKSIGTNDGDLYFSNSDTTYTIINHEINAEEMTDVVTLNVSGRGNYKNIKATVEYTLCYDGVKANWQIQESQIIDMETTFVDGYEIEISEERALRDLTSWQHYINVFGSVYFWADEYIAITDVELGEKVYDGYRMTVPVTVTANCEGVSFDAHYNLIYYFDDYDEWVVNGAEVIKLSDFKGDIIGVWAGRYGNDQMVVTINDFCHTTEIFCVDVIVEVTLSTGENYKYSSYVYRYEHDSGFISIRPYDIIGIAPEGSYMNVMEGYCINGVFTPYTGYDEFYLTKIN